MENLTGFLRDCEKQYKQNKPNKNDLTNSGKKTQAITNIQHIEDNSLGAFGK